LKPWRTIYGVDFSGARDAGRKIWVTRGTVKGGVLCIDDCLRGNALPGSGDDRRATLKALRAYILSEPSGAFGLDFPFGLPRDLADCPGLVEFIVAFPNKYRDPETFRKSCLSLAQGREKRRKTEGKAKTPFSPYNLRIYKQTFFGISAVLNPLMRNDLVRILPVQKPSAKKPVVLEICPASTLRRLSLYGSRYKGAGSEHRKARAQILQEIVGTHRVHFQKPKVAEALVENKGGDALDSVIAAIAVHGALSRRLRLTEEDKQIYGVEGYVYF
jgi:hypothetical protein